jgi:hypothetical protein
MWSLIVMVLGGESKCCFFLAWEEVGGETLYLFGGFLFLFAVIDDISLSQELEDETDVVGETFLVSLTLAESQKQICHHIEIFTWKCFLGKG